MNILILGDIVGRPGRLAIKKALPKLKKKYDVDFTIANADNLTHGVGPTRDKIEEVFDYGVNYFTNGDHVFRFKQVYSDLDDDNFPLIRPANYPESAPGRGHQIVDLGKSGQILIINLLGQVFMRDNPASPFDKVQEILSQYQDVHFAAIVVDFHAEATSEKRAMGFFLDGRVSAVVGTHTHVPTADAQVLPQGTAYVSDLGMVGTKNSILGENKDSVLEHFIQKTPHRYTIEEDGELALGGVLVTVDKNGLAKKIIRCDVEVSQ